MKKLMFIIFISLYISGYSQEKRDTTSYVYCDIVAVAKYSSAAGNPFNVNLFIDYGNGEEQIKDKNGKEFESAINAINYLAENGWQLFSTTAFFMAGSSGRWVTHHFLKKPKFIK